MKFSNNLLALAAALFAQEAVALNTHRHAHNRFHAKKEVVYVDDVVTVTDWTVVTVYEDGSPVVQTTGPKAVFKGAGHTDQATPATTTTTWTSTTSKTMTSSTSTTSSSSTSSSSSTTPVAAAPTVVTPAVVDTPTTFATVVKASSSSTFTPKAASSPVAPADAQANTATTSTVVPAVVAPATPTTSTAAAAAAPTTAVVAAAATTAVSSSSSGSSSGSTKRGLAYNAGALLAPFLNSGTKCSWSYNWGQEADSAAPSSLEFVPMLWGPTHADGWSSTASKAISNGATHFLGFNECDNAGQCNLDAASAAAAHIKYMNPYSGQVRIGAPAITNSNLAGEGVDWLNSFVSACGGQCAFDFCAAHWYNNADATEFLSHLESVHEACGKPIWITEFAPFGTDDEINAFLETVLDALDNNAKYSFVERYSYFMAATGSLLSSTTSLSVYGNTYAYS